MSSTTPPFKTGERGFTLVEVLVALVATAFLVAILLDGSVSAAARQQDNALAQQALSVAQSRIDDLRDISGAPAQRNGEEDGVRWTLQEREIARDRRGAFILVEARISAGSEDKPQLITFQKRYVRSLIVR
ncbi:prepilin-type N-terminal cleavage/methylation domain-containing protein [Parasphingorhabdus marina DSM 22363]|uniref:Prepilin-type N-terminal cleavage/methylation domain-containing protein n=1 Tax=Parasphingorhabdus marina DSM 22363 TaxID=1123272 RepID=A0A1N6HLC6_9SPHN|nr:type II secretion system protein [Parasphingorhabdus marina]SIO20644.1 prepilin-type N-terminal cleavage/methylation domain-containing protein [Parasphingorhabdus marina DSM 22363]